MRLSLPSPESMRHMIWSLGLPLSGGSSEPRSGVAKPFTSARPGAGAPARLAISDSSDSGDDGGGDGDGDVLMLGLLLLLLLLLTVVLLLERPLRSLDIQRLRTHAKWRNKYPEVPSTQTTLPNTDTV